MKPQSAIETLEAPIVSNPRTMGANDDTPSDLPICRDPRAKDTWFDETLDGRCSPSALDGACIFCEQQVPGHFGAYTQLLMARLHDASVACDAGHFRQALAELAPVVTWLASEAARKAPPKSVTHEIARLAMRTMANVGRTTESPKKR